ncbi:patatin-like phospholipase family protein [Nocardiopsis trehalosi]|uniref:patatin-like phospholipase family protein n=1 Tax=Nocardiopsis trehalosi TaxID=109329 RepID=UPI00082D3E87|nr:patatin-like phospholipase family protein [Nocardiopsis trehalosi]
MRTALVLGGGGITGIAWELGLLAGLRGAGLDLTGADLVVGTSAGSVVGAQATSGADLDDLYARQLRPPRGEAAARMPRTALARWAWAFVRERDPDRARARIGRMAHRRSTSSPAERRRVISARLPTRDWPDGTDLRVVAVDARTGRRAVLDRDSGVPLLDAVMASCAVPGVWPPVPLRGRPHVDGGVYSATGADLAAGCDRVAVLAPIARGLGPVRSPAAELAGLPGAPRTALVVPDAAARAAIGGNVLDPARRAAAARAGRAQAERAADRVAAAWTAAG